MKGEKKRKKKVLSFTFKGGGSQFWNYKAAFKGCQSKIQKTDIQCDCVSVCQSFIVPLRDWHWLWFIWAHGLHSFTPSPHTITHSFGWCRDIGVDWTDYSYLPGCFAFTSTLMCVYLYCTQLFEPPHSPNPCRCQLHCRRATTVRSTLGTRVAAMLLLWESGTLMHSLIYLTLCFADRVVLLTVSCVFYWVVVVCDDASSSCSQLSPSIFNLWLQDGGYDGRTKHRKVGCCCELVVFGFGFCDGQTKTTEHYLALTIKNYIFIIVRVISLLVASREDWTNHLVILSTMLSFLWQSEGFSQDSNLGPYSPHSRDFTIVYRRCHVFYQHNYRQCVRQSWKA